MFNDRSSSPLLIFNFKHPWRARCSPHSLSKIAVNRSTTPDAASRRFTNPEPRSRRDAGATNLARLIRSEDCRCGDGALLQDEHLRNNRRAIIE